MRIHILQHVPFEGPGCISSWCGDKQLSLTKSFLYQGDPLPQPQDFDLLIVLGGPMSIGDDQQYPWLKDELTFIKDCIDQGKALLGICLGAQMIAHSLGAAVTQNPEKEIGWFELSRHAALDRHPLADIFSERFDAFHWHGDTFALPDGALPLASSEACANQGLVYDKRVIALQFHLEMNLGAAQLLMKNGHAELIPELIPAPFIQTAAEMLARPERFDQAQLRMYQLLDYLLAQSNAE